MKNSKYIFFFLVILFCITDCKKYPEGPWISFRYKETRLLGNWKIEKYLIDGADSTAIKFPNLSSSVCVYSFGHTANYVGDGCYSIGGKWGFDNNRTHLGIGTQNVPEGPFFLAEAVSWDILRLSNKDMHLKTTFSSKEYEIYFKKQK